MKQAIKQYFQFSRRERNGIFVLLFVLIALILLKFSVPLWVQVDENEAQKQFQQNAQQLKQLANQTTGQPTSVTLKPFNPNTYPFDSLMACGLSQKLAVQIINYRQKVGLFATKADFAKLYHLSDSQYKMYYPYLLLPEKPVNSPSRPAKPKIVELNAADSLQLLQVKGIGPFFAHKILEYRRQLGGYYTIEQLGEAFYINANTLAEQQQRMAEIKSQLTVNPALITKLNINTATQKELSRHPYIDYKESKAIVKLRNKTGTINSSADLVKAGILSPQKEELLKHYLIFQ